MDEERQSFDCAVTAGRVQLTVTIGEGQLGATTVFRDGSVVVKGGVVIGNLDLGDGGDVQNTGVSVESIVNDISTQTNRMSVTYAVTNNGQRRTFTSRHKVDNEGDLCRFVTALNFTA